MLETAVTSTLVEAWLPIVVANPRQIRDFAKTAGHLATTDRMDVRILTHFAAVIRSEHPCVVRSVRRLVWRSVRGELPPWKVCEKQSSFGGRVSDASSLTWTVASISWVRSHVIHHASDR